MLEILYNISLWSNLLPLIGGLYFYKKHKFDFNQRLFLYYAGFIVFTQVVNSSVAYAGYYNIWFFELTLLIDVAFFYFFYNSWSPYKLWFKVYTFLVFLFLALMIPMSYLVLHTEQEVSYTFPVAIIYFVVQCSMMIIKTFEKNDTEFNQSYIFWISFARLFYFMAILPFNVFIFIFNHLESDVRTVYQIADSSVNFVSNIILNVLLMYSFKCRR